MKKFLTWGLRLSLSFWLISYAAMANSAEIRIVSAGGSVTETLYALGMGQHLVATDTSSTYPESAAALPKVGYYRQLSVEGVLSMAPTALFVVKGAGPAAVLTQLKSTGLKVHEFDQPTSVSGLLQLVEKMGIVTGLTKQATHLQQSIQDDIARLKPNAEETFDSAVFFMAANDRGFIAAGQDTVPNLIMNVLGITNPYQDLQGYKPISIESLLAINPRHIFVAAHGTGGLNKTQLCQKPSLVQWAITTDCAIHIVEPLLFLGLTPRLPLAIERYANLTRINTLDR